MKTRLSLLTLIPAICLLPPTLLQAGTTIDAANHYACGANLGWMDWRGDTINGAVIGEYICTGYIYSANVGWIALGSGAPADGIYYQNNSATDWGVNQDGLGNLRGYAYSANCGWISLSNAVAYVQTDAIAPGMDKDGDGIPDAWELQHFGNLTTANATSDHDGDGVSDKNEYLASTDPNNASDYLRITYVARGDVMPNFTTLHWTSVPTRFYNIDYRETLNATDSWALSVGFGFGAYAATFNTGHTNATEFYRVEAYRPLTP